MSEINGTNFSVNHMNLSGVQKNQPQTNEEVEAEKKQFSDFSDPKAEALGRSMLVKGNDDINNDLKALLENPQIAENSDKMFEAAYEIAQANGAQNPYEEAASFATTSV